MILIEGLNLLDYIKSAPHSHTQVSWNFLARHTGFCLVYSKATTEVGSHKRLLVFLSPCSKDNLSFLLSHRKGAKRRELRASTLVFQASGVRKPSPPLEPELGGSQVRGFYLSRHLVCRIEGRFQFWLAPWAKCLSPTQEKSTGSAISSRF